MARSVWGTLLFFIYVCLPTYTYIEYVQKVATMCMHMLYIQFINMVATVCLQNPVARLCFQDCYIISLCTSLQCFLNGFSVCFIGIFDEVILQFMICIYISNKYIPLCN